MRVTRKKPAPTGVLRACFNARVPGFGAVIRSAAEMREIPAWVREMQLSADWDLLYFHTPVRIRIGSKRRPWLSAGANTAVLLSPFAHFWIDTRPSDGHGHHSWINIEALDHAAVPRLPCLREGVPYLRDPDGVLGEVMTGLVDLVVELQDRSFWALQLVGNRILGLLARAVPQADGSLTLGGQAPVSVDPLVARVLAHLSTHLSGKLTLGDIAKALNTSLSTLSHHYRQTTGETALETHRRMRLLEVKRLLSLGQPLAAIAAEVGYCDVHHLSREFKRQEGMTPRAFVARYLST